MICSGSAAFTVSVLVEMSDTGDFLDSLLAEWFGAPNYSSPQSSILPTAPSCEQLFVDSVADFDLCLLQPSSSSSPASSGDPTLFVPRCDSLQAYPTLCSRNGR